MKHFVDFTVPAGVTLTIQGTVAITCTGTCRIDGTISGDGGGGAGGAAGSAGGSGGYGGAGAAGSGSTGGGGGGAGNPDSGSHGGGGGGKGGNGGYGGGAYRGAGGAANGAVSGAPVPGGGGGGGSGAHYGGGVGGAGAAALDLTANALVGTGAIHANGLPGTAGAGDAGDPVYTIGGAGGGGGAGGHVRLRANTINTGMSVSATGSSGGPGGPGSAGGVSGGGGGGGAGGYVRVEYGTNGGALPALAAGAGPSGGGSAQAGAAGVVSLVVASPDVTNYTYPSGATLLGTSPGHARVDESDRLGTFQHEFIATGDTTYPGRAGLRSRETKRTARNPDGTAVDVRTWSWTLARSAASPAANEIQSPQLAADEAWSSEASSKQVVRTEYAYDAYGNRNLVVQRGDQAVTGDERTLARAYAYATGATYIVDRPTTETLYAGTSTAGAALVQTKYSYDGQAWGTAPTQGLLTKVERTGLSPAPQQTEVTLYEYDGGGTSLHGNLTKETRLYDPFNPADARNAQTDYAYEATFKTFPTTVIVKATGTLSFPTTRTFDARWGAVQTVADPNGATTTYGYDPFGRLTDIWRPGDSTAGQATVHYDYAFGSAPNRLTITEYDQSAGTDGGKHTIQFYDGLGRLVETKAELADNAGNAGQVSVTRRLYRERGLVDKEFVAYGPGPQNSSDFLTKFEAVESLSPAQPSTGYAYDAAGRVTRVTGPDGASSTTVYGDPPSAGAGGTRPLTDPLGHQTVRYLDGYGRLKRVDEHNGAAGTATTTYAYDLRDHLTQVTDAANNTASITYDSLGRKTQLVDPDAGTWLYDYDALGRLTRQRDANLQWLYFCYDNASRLTQKRTGDCATGGGAQLAAFTYDSTASGNKGLGRRTGMADASGSTAWTFDDRGRVTQQAQTILGAGYTTSYAYDRLDRPTAVTYPDGEQVTTGYGAHGLPVTLSGTTGPTTYLSGATFTPLFQPLGWSYGSGASATFDYYDTANELDREGVVQPRDNRLKQLSYTAPGGALLQQHDYRYDRTGNVLRWWQTDQQGTLRRWSYGYDERDQLVSAAVGGVAGAGSVTLSAEPASPAAIAPGGSAAVTWANVAAPTTADWIGLYRVAPFDTGTGADGALTLTINTTWPNGTVKQFTDFTLAAGITLTIQGSVTLKCTGTCRIDGTIAGDGQGGAGGAGGTAGGSGGSGGPGGNGGGSTGGSGGGAGSVDGGSHAGGGGGKAGLGGSGGGGAGGAGGTVNGAVGGTPIPGGGGGGGGGAHYGGGAGGAGGAALDLVAERLEGSGSIRTNGSGGGAGTGDPGDEAWTIGGAGGGGGAGGHVRLRATTVNSTVAVSATGGTGGGGGPGSQGAPPGTGGGGGSGGYIRVEYVTNAHASGGLPSGSAAGGSGSATGGAGAAGVVSTVLVSASSSTPDTSYVTRIYATTCRPTANAALPAASGGACAFAIPVGVASGTYEFRLFAADGYAKLATSNPITVTVGAAPPSGSAAASFAYAYNASGNLTSGPLGSYTYGDAAHRHAVTAAGAHTYSYDANGAVRARTEAGTTYTHCYDAEGRQTGVTVGTFTCGSAPAANTTEFVYNADGALVAKKVGGSVARRYAAGGLYEQAFTGGGVISSSTRYYRFGGRLVAVREIPAGGGPGTLHSLHQDHLGSTSLQTSASGAYESHAFRGPFGQPWVSGGALATDLQYTGQRSLEASLGSLYHYQARWYSPVLGRFLQPDSIVPNPANPQDLDRCSDDQIDYLPFTKASGSVAQSPVAQSRGKSRVSAQPR